jgi:hypothetical protein
MAFLGANASFLYVHSVVEPTEWLEWAPPDLMIGTMGLVAGLLSYDRDPQADIKAKAALEDGLKKDLAAAKETEAK